MQDPLALGFDVAQGNWVLTQDPSALGLDTAKKKWVLTQDPRD